MKYLIIIGLALLGVVVQAQNQVGYTRRATLETMWPVPYNTWIIDYPGADSINVFVRDPSDNTSPASWRVIVGRNGIRYIRRTPPNMFNSSLYYTKTQADNNVRNRPKFLSGLQNNYVPLWRSSDSTLVASNIFNNLSTGRVGIGTASPSTTLQVSGTVSATQVNTGSIFADNIWLDGVSNSSESVGSRSVNYHWQGVLRWKLDVDGSTRNFSVQRFLNGNKQTDPISIANSNGNITLNGVTAINGNTTVTGATTTNAINLPAQGSDPAAPASGSTLYVNSAGLLSWRRSNQRIINFDASSATANRSYTLPDVSGTIGILGASQTWSATNTFTGNTFLATSSGNVGIGTASPTSKLHVEGAASATSNVVTGTGGAGFLELIAQTSSPSAPASGVRVFANSLGRFAWEGTDGFARSFNFSSMSADREVTFPAAGTVGMLGSTQTWSGTNTFTGNVNNTASYQIGGVNIISRHPTFWNDIHGWSGAVAIKLGGENDRANYYDNDRHQFRSAAGVEIMRVVASTGNVGIGTSSPAASAILDVVSTTRGVGFPQMTTTQRDAISSPRAGLVIFNTTTDKLQVRTSSAWVDLH